MVVQIRVASNNGEADNSKDSKDVSIRGSIVNGRTYFVVNMVPNSRKGLKIKSLKGQCPEIFKMKEMRIKDQIHMGDKRFTRSSLCSFLLVADNLI
jgi:hypothetical protein